MELFLELILTVSLTLIFTTTLFIKLASMPSNNTDKNTLREESLKIDKFQWMPFNEEMIKLEECPNEGKSCVEFHNVVGVEKEDDHKFQDVVVVETIEYKDCKTVDDDSGNDGSNNDDNNNNNNDGGKVEQGMFGSEEENKGGKKLCEIEIESVEEEDDEEEEKNEIMNDWEEIGRKDFEELLGNKTGLYYVGVDDNEK